MPVFTQRLSEVLRSFKFARPRAPMRDEPFRLPLVLAKDHTPAQSQSAHRASRASPASAPGHADKEAGG